MDPSYNTTTTTTTTPVPDTPVKDTNKIGGLLMFIAIVIILLIIIIILVERYFSRKKANRFQSININHFQSIRLLGEGAFGKVFMVTATSTSATYALKRVDRTLATNKNEVAIMRKANSEFIVKLFKTFQDCRYLFMLMEFCPGGELSTILQTHGPFNNRTAQFYTGCICEGLLYLHKRRVIHRDIKPENVFTDARGYAKIGDFGFAIKLPRGGKDHTACGTPGYVAPEVVRQRPYDTKVDCWSLGVLVFELLIGNLPVTGHVMDMTCINAFKNKITINGISIINDLCKVAPHERLDIMGVQTHRWFQGFNWRGLRERTLEPPTFPQSDDVDTANVVDGLPGVHVPLLANSECEP